MIRKPTYRQFRYYAEKELDFFKLARVRNPDRYNKEWRPLLGSSTAESIGPGSRFQIDATIADVYLVSRADPRKIAGRPVLYMLSDQFSHMIPGFLYGVRGSLLGRRNDGHCQRSHG